MDYKIFWAEEAIQNLEEIIDYLSTAWTQKEVNNFKLKLAKQLDLIKRNPRLFPKSVFQSRLRKAVLSKQTSVFYEVKDNPIYLIYLFVNYKNPEKLR